MVRKLVLALYGAAVAVLVASVVVARIYPESWIWGPVSHTSLKIGWSLIVLIIVMATIMANVNSRSRPVGIPAGPNTVLPPPDQRESDSDSGSEIPDPDDEKSARSQSLEDTLRILFRRELSNGSRARKPANDKNTDDSTESEETDHDD